MNRILFNIGTQLGAQRFFSNQINRTTHSVLKVKLNAEIPIRGCRPIKAYKYIDITIDPGAISRGGAEQRQMRDPESVRKDRFAARKQFYGYCSFHAIRLIFGTQ